MDHSPSWRVCYFPGGFFGKNRQELVVFLDRPLVILRNVSFSLNSRSKKLRKSDLYIGLWGGTKKPTENLQDQKTTRFNPIASVWFAHCILQILQILHVWPFMSHLHRVLHQFHPPIPSLRNLSCLRSVESKDENNGRTPGKTVKNVFFVDYPVILSHSGSELQVLHDESLRNFEFSKLSKVSNTSTEALWQVRTSSALALGSTSPARKRSDFHFKDVLLGGRGKLLYRSVILQKGLT